eukprot:TRINITY_DN976_c0_g1_i1.p1 TRINITY_DN976_c0_g1~~TRINITY_DN976_c0_g1_i1.p1  ORF type:complete len:258 (-),score=107.98 TRINITY_DN976_c0_g1_i1:22-795(-)
MAASQHLYLDDIAGYRSKTHDACRYFESKYSRPGDEISQQTEAYMADALQQIATDVERLSTQLVQVVDAQSGEIDGLASRISLIQANLLRSQQQSAKQKEVSLRLPSQPAPQYEPVTVLESVRRRAQQTYVRVPLRARLEDPYPAADMHADADDFDAAGAFDAAAPKRRLSRHAISEMSSVSSGGLPSPGSTHLPSASSSFSRPPLASERSAPSMYAVPPPQRPSYTPAAPPPPPPAEERSAVLAPPVLLSQQNRGK